MVSFFHPPGVDVKAATGEITPYVENICKNLSKNQGKLYTNFIDVFVKYGIPEAALNALIEDSEVFESEPELMWLYEDLLIVIMLNKIEGGEGC